METFDFFRRGLRVTNTPAERAVEAAAAYFSARAVIALSIEHDSMLPVAVRGTRSNVLEAILRAWSAHKEELSGGRALCGAASEMDARVTGGSFVLAPVMSGDHLSGLLYVEVDDGRLQDPKDLDALAQFSRMLAGALEAPSMTWAGLYDFLEQTPSDELARQQLLVLLERHEWNLARVARALGVTRTTIYKRLQRYGLERVRVPKTTRRLRPA